MRTGGPRRHCRVAPIGLSDIARKELERLMLYGAAHAVPARARSPKLVTLDKALLQSGLGRRPSAVVADLK
jgi:predicted nucleic acid-binding protein